MKKTDLSFRRIFLRLSSSLLSLLVCYAVGLSYLPSAWSKASGEKSLMTLPHKTATLKNGLRVVMVRYPSPGVVAYQLPVHAGSRNEVEKGKTGFAHFFEHLMFRGTKKRSSEDFGRIYNSLGCENNAWTSNDMTNYHGIVASVYLPQILDAEADRFMNLSFDEKALKDEAGAVLGEYNKDVAQPEFQMEEALMSLAFKVHPYGHTTMGYKADVLDFPQRYKDVWPFFRRYYRPSNVSLILVGDIEFNSMLKLIEKKFGHWKDPDPIDEPVIPQEPQQKESRSASVTLDKPTQSRVAIAYKVPAFTTKNTDSAVMDLISEIYFSVTSEFQKEYRFQKKWVDSIEAGHPDSIDPGLWTINLRFSQEGESHVDEVIKAAEAVLAQLAKTPPTLEKLKATKKRFRSHAISQWFSSPETLAGRIAWYTNFEPDLQVMDRVFDRFEEVQPQHLTSFAQKYFVETGKNTVRLKGN